MSRNSHRKVAEAREILGKITLGGADDATRDRFAGFTAAGNHASHMHKHGMLDDNELAEFGHGAIATMLEHLPDDAFDQLVESGDFDRLRDLSGPEEGEHQDDATARREAIALKVAVNFLAHAASKGAIEPKEALQEIRGLVDGRHRDGDDLDGTDEDHASAITAILNDSGQPGKHLTRGGGDDQMSDDDIDDELHDVMAQSWGRPGQPASEGEDD